jgi:hypothetical protein
MVAVIKAGKSIRNTLQYNEQKVKLGVAELIHSGNYAKDTDQLGFTDRLKTLQKLIALNEATKVNSVHISLNFDPSEKLPVDKLREIADAYLKKIGFGDQPYLVYQHHDSGHPHIHVVTTNIERSGNRIKLHNIGRDKSEPARKAIEKEFRLVIAQRQQQKQVQELKPVMQTQKAQYGKFETKRAITNVLDAVIPAYKYTSLAELNAVLRQYNVVADRGHPAGRIYRQEGLLYRILDEKGQKIGIPIKASSIYSKPTLKNLQMRFPENETARQVHKQRLKNAIDLTLSKGAIHSVADLEKALLKESIQLVVRQNEKGMIYGMTYVDHETKCVFNGSDLGKQYSANQMQERCRPDQPVIKPRQQAPKPEQVPTIEPPLPAPTIDLSPILSPILQSEKVSNSLPYELRQDLKRKRKRKRLHL